MSASASRCFLLIMNIVWVQSLPQVVVKLVQQFFVGVSALLFVWLKNLFVWNARSAIAFLDTGNQF